MSVQFIAPMATLDEIKARLSFGSAPHELDDVLREILLGASATIEREARRRLRREHKIVEIHSGGGRLIRTRMSPIAKIHSIRESADRDFTTLNAYTELEELEDYVIEPDQGERGESGIIRRIGAQWMGNEEAEPSQVRIEYTAGFKTPEEVENESGQITVVNTGDIIDYQIAKLPSGTSGFAFVAENETASEIVASDIGNFRNAIIGFNVKNLLPVWAISEITLRVTVKKEGSVDWSIKVMPQDARVMGNLEAIFVAAPNLNVNAAAWVGPLLSTSFTETEIHIHELVDEPIFGNVFNSVKTVLAETAKLGYAAFNFSQPSDSGNGTITTAASENASISKPQLTIRHGLTFTDEYSMRDDLRNACLTQAIHEFQFRKSPGELQSSMRGISIASGQLSVKNEMKLLPGVQAVAESYRRMF